MGIQWIWIYGSGSKDLDLWIWIYGSASDLYGKGRVKGNKNCLWTKANSNMDANLVDLLGSAIHVWIYGSGSMDLWIWI